MPSRSSTSLYAFTSPAFPVIFMEGDPPGRKNPLDVQTQARHRAAGAQRLYVADDERLIADTVAGRVV